MHVLFIFGWRSIMLQTEKTKFWRIIYRTKNNSSIAGITLFKSRRNSAYILINWKQSTDIRKYKPINLMLPSIFRLLLALCSSSSRLRTPSFLSRAARQDKHKKQFYSSTYIIRKSVNTQKKTLERKNYMYLSRKDSYK